MPSGSAFFALVPARVAMPLVALISVMASALIDLPDLETIRRWIRRIQELIVLGGIGLAIAASLVFIGAWVLSHLRKAKTEEEAEERSGWFSWVALVGSAVPVTLTVVAAAGMFVPMLRPLMLKLFAYAVAAAAVSWVISVAALIAGGGKRELARARRALLLAGTPFYSLAVWLARFLTLGF